MMEPPAPVPHRQVAVAWLYGLACHALFALGVGSMIVGMASGMQTGLGRLDGVPALVANLALLLQFPLLHSFLLTPPGTRILKRLAPPPWGGTLATTVYAALASLQALLLFLGWSPSGTVWWAAQGPVLWLILGLYATSWLLLARAIADAGSGLQTGALGWRALARGRPVRFPPMPATGLFRLCRQPIYVAFALTVWTVPVWTPDQLLVACVLTAYCVLGPLLKERRFRERFGETFSAYAGTVPYWLPWPRPRRGGPVMVHPTAVYDAAAGDWWSGRVRWLRVLQGLVPVRMRHFDPGAGGWAGKEVLDLGCGGGFMSEALARRGARVTGVDPSDPALAAARRHAAGDGLPITYLAGRGERIPAADATFDIVVCVDVFEHVDDLAAVAREIARVLRPGGRLLFDTVNRTALAGFVLVTLGERVLRLVPPGTHDPRRFVRPAELGALLAGAGLAMGPLTGLGPVGLDRRLDPVFGRVPGTAVLYLGAARRLQ